MNNKHSICGKIEYVLDKFVIGFGCVAITAGTIFTGWCIYESVKYRVTTDFEGRAKAELEHRKELVDSIQEANKVLKKSRIDSYETEKFLDSTREQNGSIDRFLESRGDSNNYPQYDTVER